MQTGHCDQLNLREPQFTAAAEALPGEK